MAIEQATGLREDDNTLETRPAFHSASPTVIDLGGVQVDLNAVSRLPTRELIVHGKSNRPLKISISPENDELMIDALDTGTTTKTSTGEFREPTMYVNIGAHPDGQGRRLLNLDISTKDITSQQYHPDMNLRAVRIADAALNFFEQASPVDGIRYNVHSAYQKGPSGEDLPSEVLVQYRKAREKFYSQYRDEGDEEEIATRKSQEQAIFHSSAGKFGRRHRFTRVDRIFEETDPRTGEIRAVSAVILKSNEQPQESELTLKVA